MNLPDHIAPVLRRMLAGRIGDSLEFSRIAEIEVGQLDAYGIDAEDVADWLEERAGTELASNERATLYASTLAAAATTLCRRIESANTYAEIWTTLWGPRYPRHVEVGRA
jgi:hypothetical protein